MWGSANLQIRIVVDSPEISGCISFDHRTQLLPQLHQLSACISFLFYFRQLSLHRFYNSTIDFFSHFPGGLFARLLAHSERSIIDVDIDGESILLRCWLTGSPNVFHSGVQSSMHSSLRGMMCSFGSTKSICADSGETSDPPTDVSLAMNSLPFRKLMMRRYMVVSIDGCR